MSSLASGREARRIAPNAKKNALAQLADLKNKGIKRSDQFEVCAAGGGGGGVFVCRFHFIVPRA